METLSRPGSVIRDPQVELGDRERAYFEEFPIPDGAFLVRGVDGQLGIVQVPQIGNSQEPHVTLGGYQDEKLEALAGALGEESIVCQRIPEAIAQEDDSADLFGTQQEAMRVADARNRGLDPLRKEWGVYRTSRGFAVIPSERIRQDWRFRAIAAKLDVLARSVGSGYSVFWINPSSAEREE